MSGYWLLEKKTVHTYQMRKFRGILANEKMKKRERKNMQQYIYWIATC